MAQFKLKFMYATINADEGLNVCNVFYRLTRHLSAGLRSVAQLVIREKNTDRMQRLGMLPDS